MENKPTPGPWRISGCHTIHNGQIHPFIEHGDESELSPLIAEVYADGGRLPTLANAQLIAASPTMLTALQKALIFIEDEHATREISALPEPNNDEAHYITEAQDALDIVRAAIDLATAKTPTQQAHHTQPLSHATTTHQENSAELTSIRPSSDSS